MVITPFKCIVCSKWKGEHHLGETLHFVDDSSTDLDICDECVEEAEESRKFEGAYARALYELDMDGMEEDYMSSEWGDYVALFGNWLLYCDSQGFVTAEEFRSVEAAVEHFTIIHDEGMGYHEEDATIYADNWGNYQVSFDGKHIANVRREDYENPLRRAKAIISVEMRKSGFFPNVWLTDDRTARRIEVW